MRGGVSTRATGPAGLRRSRRSLVVAAAACCLAGLAGGAAAQPARGPARGGMATRSVAHYLELERGLLDALARSDRAAVLARLADDFTARTPESDEVDSADDWLQRELRAPQGRSVRDLSVREVDDLAIVSFVVDRHAGGRGSGAPWFVVDAWRRSTDRLVARSISRPAVAAPRPTRPTGKE